MVPDSETNKIWRQDLSKCQQNNRLVPAICRINTTRLKTGLVQGFLSEKATDIDEAVMHTKGISRTHQNDGTPLALF